MANQPTTGTELQQHGNTNFKYADNADGTKNVGSPVIDNFIKGLFGGGPPTDSSPINRGGFGPVSNPGMLPTVQIGTTAPTPALGIQAPLDQDPIDEGGSMDYLGERRFPTPPTKPVPPSQGYDPFDRKEVFRATPGLNLPNDPKNFTETYIDPIQPTLDSIGNALGSAGEAVSGAIDSTGEFLGENLPPYGDSQAAIMKFIEENFPDGTMSGLVDAGQNGINGLLEQIMEIYNSNSTNEVAQMQNPGNAFDPNINANLRLPQLKAQIPQ